MLDTFFYEKKIHLRNRIFANLYGVVIVHMDKNCILISVFYLLHYIRPHTAYIAGKIRIVFKITLIVMYILYG